MPDDPSDSEERAYLHGRQEAAYQVLQVIRDDLRDRGLIVSDMPTVAVETATYVYVASSWRNPIQADLCAALTAAGIEHYDFKNPPGGTGFSWKQVKPKPPGTCPLCRSDDPEVRAEGRHLEYGPMLCPNPWHDGGSIPGKGSDWEPVEDYLAMVNDPIAVAGYQADFDAMQRADTIVLVLPCGKSAHLELGWAVGAGKRTAILLEDPVEPELMYRIVDFMATSTEELLDWLGVKPRG